MEFLKNIKKEHFLFTFLFLMCFFIYILCHYHYKEGLFFDQPAMFYTIISEKNLDYNEYFLFFDNRVRFFNNFLVSIPFNIFIWIYQYIKHDVNILNYLCMFTSSYYIVHLFALLVNFLVALRTKRYDIAIIGFAFYTFFCLINLIWAVRELHITILFYFPLLSYFLSKEKLVSKDFIPILLLSVYLFESFEINIIFGLIIQFFTLLYTITRNDNNIAYKNIIGSICFLASIYIILKLAFWIPDAVGGGIEQYLFAIKFYTQNVLSTGGAISVTGLFVFLIIIFYKKTFHTLDIIPFFLLIFSVAIAMWKWNMYVTDGAYELNAYGWTIVVIFPTILTIILMDYFNIDISKFNPSFYSNLYTLACLVGIFQLIWQIHTCYDFNKYVSYVRNLIKNSNEKLIEISEEDYSKYNFLRFYSGYGIIHQSVLLNPTKDVEKLVVPLSFQKFELDWNSPNRTYQKEEDTYILHDSYFTQKNSKYINVAPIVKYVEKHVQKQSN